MEPLAFRRPAAQAGHVGFRPRLVDEHQSPGIDKALIGPPTRAMAAYVRAVLLARDKRLLWTAPSFRRCRLAGSSDGGADHEDCGAWQTRWQRMSVVGLDASGAVVLRRRASGDGDCVGGEAFALHCGDGGLVRGAHHLGRVFAAHGQRSEADVARICPALHQSAVRMTIATPKGSPKRRRARRCGLSS